MAEKSFGWSCNKASVDSKREAARRGAIQMVMAQDDKWLQQIFVRGDDVVQVLAMADKMFKALAKEMMSTSSLSQEMDPWGTVCFKLQDFHPLCCDACFVYFNYVFLFGRGYVFPFDCSPGSIP